ncbi:MAG: hypothetical protein ABL931_06215 [Usitatibacteraceae bacterium]
MPLENAWALPIQAALQNIAMSKNSDDAKRHVERVTRYVRVAQEFLSVTIFFSSPTFTPTAK